MPTSRLLDLKLKCVFEFTEAEQQRLPQLTPQTNDTLSIQSSRSSTGASSQDTLSTASTQSKPSSTASSTPSQRSTTTVTSAAAAAPVVATSNKQAAAAINTTVDSLSTSLNDFDSTARSFNKTLNSGPAAAKLDKNDNLSNELKLSRQENESLKKEIARLKVTFSLS